MTASRRIFDRWLIATLVLVVAMAGGVGAWLHGRFGSVSDGIAFLSGRTLLLERQTLDFGAVPGGTFRTARVAVRNHGAAEVRLLGTRASCTCTTIEGLPITVGPGQQAVLDVKVHARDPKKPIDESIQIFTDHPTIRYLDMRVIAAVTEAVTR